MHDPLFRKFLKEEKMNYKKRGQRKSFYRMLMIATVTKRRWLDALEERRKQ